MPLLVCLPGGGYNASYFDVAGYSLLDAARREGFPVVSLDRPGHGGSTALKGEVTFRRNAEVLLAAGDRTWPLLGVSVSGIHHESQRSNDALKSQPQNSSLEFSREHLLRFMYGPEDTYDPGVPDIAKHAESSVPDVEDEPVDARVLGRDLVEEFLPPTGDDHLVARLVQAYGESAADARGAAGDQDRVLCRGRPCAGCVPREAWPAPPGRDRRSMDKPFSRPCAGAPTVETAGAHRPALASLSAPS